MNVLLIEPGEYARVADIAPNLIALQQLVGGYIEVLFPFEDQVALVFNDEAHRKGMPLNRQINDQLTIAGPFFICGVEEDSFTSLSPEQTERFKREFECPELFIRMGRSVTSIAVKPEDYRRIMNRQYPQDWEEKTTVGHPHSER